jgi:hypothetical protein
MSNFARVESLSHDLCGRAFLWVNLPPDPSFLDCTRVYDLSRQDTTPQLRDSESEDKPCFRPVFERRGSGAGTAKWKTVLIFVTFPHHETTFGREYLGSGIPRFRRQLVDGHLNLVKPLLNRAMF